MKKKHTRIIALIIVLAVVVTTVMSTVMAFADETDYDYDYNDGSSYSEDDSDYDDEYEDGDDYDDDYDYDDDISQKYDFSNVALSRTNVVLCNEDDYSYTTIALTGMPAISEDDYWYLSVSDVVSSNPEISVNISMSDVATNAIDVSVEGTGTTTVTFSFEGKQLSFTLTLVRAWLSKYDYRVAKGGSVQIKVNGDLNGIAPKFRSLSPKVASVSSSGKVKAKKSGVAVITVSLGDGDDSGTLGTCVNVASAKKVKAFNWARSYASKSTYSQAKRMSKGYYDCSSLVWRAYRSQGIRLVNRNWAPTAADLAKGLVSKHKKVGAASDKNYSSGKFQIGDLFFETGADNGRYKGVYHVEMFGGYTFGGFDEAGKPYIISTYASRGDGYGYSDDCFLCRP